MYNMPVAHKTGYSLELYAYARGGARRSPQKKRIFTMIEFTDQHLLIFGIVLALSTARAGRGRLSREGEEGVCFPAAPPGRGMLQHPPQSGLHAGIAAR